MTHPVFSGFLPLNCVIYMFEVFEVFMLFAMWED